MASIDLTNPASHAGLLARVFEALDEPLVIGHFENSKILFSRVNQSFEDATGFTRRQLVGRFDDMLWGSGTTQRSVEALRRAVLEGKPKSVEVEMYCARKDGPTVVRISVAPIAIDVDAKDQTPTCVLHFVNVSQQAIAQEELKQAWESERNARRQFQSMSRRLTALVAQMPSGVVVVDAPSGRVAGANSRATSILGSLSDLSLLEDGVAVGVKRENGSHYLANELPVTEVFETGSATEEIDCQFDLPDGSTGYGVMRAAPVTDDGGRLAAVMLLIDDITRRRRAELELAESQRKSLELAHSLQQSMLPSKFPSVDFVDFGAVFIPLGDGLEVGGDFYDVFEQRDGDLVAVIGDVMGKGVRAAAVTSLARHVLRTTALRSRRVSTLLHMLNEALCREDGDIPFATVATTLLVPDVFSQTVELTVGLAGHGQPLVLRNSGKVQRVGKAGTLVGAVDEIEVFEERYTLEPGDSLVFFTDGVTETRNEAGEFYGEDHLAELLISLDSKTAADAQSIATAIADSARAFGNGEASDDLAVLVVRVKEHFTV